jgi:hypothetical protein
MVRRHELDIADLGKPNEQLTASVKSFVLTFPSAIGKEEGASFGRSSLRLTFSGWTSGASRTAIIDDLIMAIGSECRWQRGFGFALLRTPVISSGFRWPVALLRFSLE